MSRYLDVRRCNVISTRSKRNKHNNNNNYVNICDTVQSLAEFLQCNCGKVKETEGLKGFYLYCLLCVRIEIDQP